MSQFAKITAIEYVLPVKTLSNEDLARDFPEWNVDKIFSKTGINNRQIAGVSECASDLAFQACDKLLNAIDLDRSAIDLLSFARKALIIFYQRQLAFFKIDWGYLLSVGPLTSIRAALVLFTD